MGYANIRVFNVKRFSEIFGAIFHLTNFDLKDVNRASESVVFNSYQKMALRAAYVVIC